MDLEKYITGEELFDGHYRLIKLLSEEGGTSDVWLAENDKSSDTTFSEIDDDIVKVEGTGVLVALKIYRPKNALDVDGEQSFRQEFKTIFDCHHANLIPTTDYSICEGMPYLVMPFCENGSSEKLIGKLTNPDEIWKFIFDTASGLEYLHSCSPPIIHQDIKPANILIDKNGNYCITDFGISVKYGMQDEQAKDNEGFGTKLYMPHERFENGYSADASSDIWALGATIFELIHGDTPFGAEGGGIQTDNEIPQLSHKVPRDLRKLICSCLNYDPLKRPSAHQIAETARRKREKRKSNTIWFYTLALTILLISSVSLLSQFIKPKNPFLMNYNSADSILFIQKQNAHAVGNINYEKVVAGLEEAKKYFDTALGYETKDLSRIDSASIKIHKIEELYPLLNRYKGALDTLSLAIEDDLPIQISKYQKITGTISDQIRLKIIDL